MNSAPDLVLLEVFSHSSVEEKFGTLRLVCKNWKQVIESSVLKELVVYEDNFPLKKRWPSDDSPVDLRNVVRKPFFDFHLDSGRYKAIKRLLLYRIDWNKFKGKGLLAKLLDCICQLEELSIDQKPSIFYADDWLENVAYLDGLTLPNLRVLSVKQNFRGKISITAPKLEKLIVWDQYHTIEQQRLDLMIVLSHPERLKSLQCQGANLKTRLFPNLEQLTSLNVALDFDLSHFPKLKRLDICLCYCTEGFHRNTQNLLEQRRRLQMNDLVITNLGAKAGVGNPNYIVENSPSECIQILLGQDLGYFVENFMVDYLPWVFEFDWTACIYERLGALGRFRLNIECVTISGPERKNEFPDPNTLIKFLVEIGGVQCLTILNCSFTQEFYEKLTVVPYICHLYMNFEPRKARFTPDFDFIGRMRWLDAITLSVDNFTVDSFWVAFKRTKIRRLQIKIIKRNKPFYPILKLNKNQNALRFQYFGSGVKDREFDNKDAAFSALKEELEKSPEQS